MRARMGWIAGATGAAAAALALLLMRAVLGGPSLPEVVQDAVVLATPGAVFSFLLDQLRFTGRPLLFALILVGMFDVVFHCRDDYTDSIPVDRARMPGTLVVYEMDGAPLTEKHGFPARVIVPGIFGMKNAKWVQRVEVVGRGYRAIGIADHAGPGNMAPLLAQLVEACAFCARHWDIWAFPGVELTHLPPAAIAEAAREARQLGARLVVVHGETPSEPVEPG